MFGKLKDVQKVVIINAGHWDDPHTPGIDDPGASFNHVTEQVECAKIRDRLVPILAARGYIVKVVPDNLSLPKSIEYANTVTQELNGALAIDIHLNYLSDTSARGVEAFHGESETSADIAKVISSSVSSALGIPNRGEKPDTQTAVGSLGWIRQTKMWATLIEVCFLTNAEDMKVLLADDGHRKAAEGIANGVDYLFGVTEKPADLPLRQFATMELIRELQWRIKNNAL